MEIVDKEIALNKFFKRLAHCINLDKQRFIVESLLSGDYKIEIKEYNTKELDLTLTTDKNNLPFFTPKEDFNWWTDYDLDKITIYTLTKKEE